RERRASPGRAAASPRAAAARRTRRRPREGCSRCHPIRLAERGLDEDLDGARPRWDFSLNPTPVFDFLEEFAGKANVGGDVLRNLLGSGRHRITSNEQLVTTPTIVAESLRFLKKTRRQPGNNPATLAHRTDDRGAVMRPSGATPRLARLAVHDLAAHLPSPRIVAAPRQREARPEGTVGIRELAPHGSLGT